MQVGEDGRQVSATLDGRAGGDADADAHLDGDDVGQRGLAKAGRAVEQDVIECFAARPGSRDGDAQVLFYLSLSDELRQAFGAQVGVQRDVFSQRLARNNARYGRLLFGNLKLL